MESMARIGIALSARALQLMQPMRQRHPCSSFSPRWRSCFTRWGQQLRGCCLFLFPLGPLFCGFT
ncbi:unnamed protein product [Cladocopium goreaui]|uniref:Uncharacterized protein n=1 Tax=Cladocopium goreaui TaxID=2562237 RepID=A0A9P1FJI3_9DINO|nr:unnamed protein product [Cladocopium goreaui]